MLIQLINQMRLKIWIFQNFTFLALNWSKFHQYRILWLSHLLAQWNFGTLNAFEKFIDGSLQKSSCHVITHFRSQWTIPYAVKFFFYGSNFETK